MSVANVAAYWSSGNLIITEKTIGNNATISFGVNSDGIDVIFYGASAGAKMTWDESANALVFAGGATITGGGLTSYSLADTVDLVFGDGSDVLIQWDATNLLIAAAADDSLIEFGDSAATQKSFDLKWYGNEANGASYLYADASANLIYTTGVDLQFKDNDILVIGSGAGANGDVQFVWDTTNLIMKAIADDTVWEIGDSAASQLSFDLKWYAGENSGASYLYADASANLIYTTGVDFQFKDADFLVFGSGSGATGDVQIQWDATNLLITATADDTIIEIGDAATPQLSFDIKAYGNAAAGADYLFWDASGSVLTTVGAATIAGRTGDANGIGLTLSVKTDAGAPGTTGTPTGSIVFNTNDNKFYVKVAAGWVASAALA